MPAISTEQTQFARYEVSLFYDNNVWTTEGRRVESAPEDNVWFSVEPPYRSDWKLIPDRAITRPVRLQYAPAGFLVWQALPNTSMTLTDGKVECRLPIPYAHNTLTYARAACKDAT